jgi:hypothetical protein
VNAVPTTVVIPAGLVMTGAGVGADAEAITSVSTAVLVPPGPVADSVTEDVPAAAGVPEITPVAGLRVRPVGNPVAANWVTPPLAFVA